MRGRLRIDGRVFGENPSWLEVPVEYWSKRLPAGSDAPVIPEPILAPGDETPKYGGTSSPKFPLFPPLYMHALCSVISLYDSCGYARN